MHHTTLYSVLPVWHLEWLAQALTAVVSLSVSNIFYFIIFTLFNFFSFQTLHTPQAPVYTNCIIQHIGNDPCTNVLDFFFQKVAGLNSAGFSDIMIGDFHVFQRLLE